VSPAIERIQKHLDTGKSNSEAARLEGLSEGAVRYGLKKGLLKKRPRGFNLEVQQGA
jgi:hypothetical protein